MKTALLMLMLSACAPMPKDCVRARLEDLSAMRRAGRLSDTDWWRYHDLLIETHSRPPTDAECTEAQEIRPTPPRPVRLIVAPDMRRMSI